MNDYYDLGSYSRNISTSSPEAQLWFDRGLMWNYGFHHEEAIECFKKVLKYDPHCAMAHCGIAYATVRITTSNGMTLRAQRRT